MRTSAQAGHQMLRVVQELVTARSSVVGDNEPFADQIDIELLRALIADDFDAPGLLKELINNANQD